MRFPAAVAAPAPAPVCHTVFAGAARQIFAKRKGPLLWEWEVQMSAKKVGKTTIFLGNFDYEDEEDAARMPQTSFAFGSTD